MTLAPGTKLGPYEILGPFGVGGGSVEGTDKRLGRIVAEYIPGDKEKWRPVHLSALR